jgi:hypothetical protein
MKNKFVGAFVIASFVMLYLVVSIISTIHVIDFFLLSNPKWLAISLAICFEIGAAASLASLIVLEKMNKTVVWMLFIVLTLMQAMGNMYYSYSHANNYDQWMELFGLIEEEEIFQKRVLSFISGAILPLVSLGFIKSLVDYIKPEKELIGVNSDILESAIDETDNEDKSPSNENESPDEEISIEKKEDKFVDPTRIK